MMLLAVSAGNPLISGEILFAFVLGTSPMFFAIGMAANEIFKRKALLYLAATVVAVLGIISINNGQILRGSVHTFNNYYKVALGNKQISKVGDVVNIEVTNKGYKNRCKYFKTWSSC